MKNKILIWSLGVCILLSGFYLTFAGAFLPVAVAAPQAVLNYEDLKFFEQIEQIWQQDSQLVIKIMGEPSQKDGNRWLYQRDDRLLTIGFDQKGLVFLIDLIYNEPVRGQQAENVLMRLGIPPLRLTEQNEAIAIWQTANHWQITGEQVNFGGWPVTKPEIKVFSFQHFSN